MEEKLVLLNIAMVRDSEIDQVKKKIKYKRWYIAYLL